VTVLLEQKILSLEFFSESLSLGKKPSHDSSQVTGCTNADRLCQKSVFYVRL